MKKSLALAALALAALVPAAASAAASYYTTETAWQAATGNPALSLQDFEGTPTSTTATSLTYGDVTFSCSGNNYCPDFFGTRSLGNSTAGPTTVYGAVPDSLIFTFSHTITVFGVDVIGFGSNGTSDLTVRLSNGSSQVVLSQFSSDNAQFVGVYDAAGFNQVTFTGTRAGDGVDFDRLQSTPSVPEPGNLALMLAGVGAIGAAARRRGSRKA